MKPMLTVLRPYINWSCISTWTQTSTVWTGVQRGRKTHRHYMNTQDTDVQTDNMYIVLVMLWQVDLFVHKMFQQFFFWMTDSNRFTRYYKHAVTKAIFCELISQQYQLNWITLLGGFIAVSMFIFSDSCCCFQIVYLTI